MMEEKETRVGTRFQWNAVDGRVVRRLLLACDVEQRYTRTEITTLTDDLAARSAAASFGEPPRPEFTDELVEVALAAWLPLASAEEVEALTTWVQSGLSGAARTQVLGTKSERISFLRARNRTTNFKTNVRKHFLAAHKVRNDKPRKPSIKMADLTPVRLCGGGLPAPHPLHPHQADAVAALNRLVRGKRVGPAGVLVLPTGSGKTETMVTWLLDRMAADPALRVLWIAGQQELLNQAAARFETWAGSQPVGFERLGRVIHGASYPTSQLANPDLDVALVTIQSLTNDLAKGRRASLHRFLARPTVVVIDEAHHVAAPSYGLLFEQLAAGDVVAVVGLTATPFPTSITARLRFREHFPVEIHKVSAEELMRQQILARPVLHTIETNLEMTLNAEELRLAEANDLPPAVLKRLDSELRNQVIVNTYLHQPDRWGKTLMFATNIEHADHLYGLLERANVRAMVMHSRMDLDRSVVLSEFKNAVGPAVLVSVGMLAEGVDLPDARTAFLSRPTTSRVLLQQMIGRVLRGPRAGGEAEANVVYFSDVWRNFSDILEPPEAISGVRAFKPPEGEQEPTSRGVFIIDSVPELDPGAVVNIGRQFDNLPSVPITSCRLVGYYQLVDQRQIPVFDHQLAPMQELLTDAMDGSLQGRPMLSYFEDGPSPHPTTRAVRDLVDFVREFQELPPFTSLDEVVGPTVGADRVLAAGPLDDAARAALIRSVYDSTLANLVYRSPAHFEEEVERELRARRERKLLPETPLPQSVSSGLRRLPRFERDLTGATNLALEQCEVLLPEELRERLDPPPIDWSERVTATNFAYWAIKPTGKSRGRQTIRINRLLRCNPKAVPDEMLAYLIYHELLHHLLPGQGHDAEFRELEHRWPEAPVLDAMFDSLHERWDTRAERYKDDHS